jgi:hypothetical protein
MNPEQSIRRSWKPGRGFFWIGLVGSILGLVILTAFTICIGHPEWKMEKEWPPKTGDLVIYYGVFGFLALVSFWLFRLGQVGGLIINGHQIIQRGAVRRQTINLADVERISWRIPPDSPGLSSQEKRVHDSNRVLSGMGLIEVFGKEKRVWLRLNSYPPKVQREIIETLRELFRDRIQIGWEEFARVRVQPPPPQFPPIRPRRILILVAIILAAYAVLAPIWLAIFHSDLSFNKKEVLSFVLFMLPIHLAFVWVGFKTVSESIKTPPAESLASGAYRLSWDFDGSIGVQVAFFSLMLAYSILESGLAQNVTEIIFTMLFLFHILVALRLEAVHQRQPLSFQREFGKLPPRQFLTLTLIIAVIYALMVGLYVVIGEGRTSAAQSTPIGLILPAVPFFLFFIYLGLRILSDQRKNQSLVAAGTNGEKSDQRRNRRFIILQTGGSYAAMYMIMASGLTRNLKTTMFVTVMVFYFIAFIIIQKRIHRGLNRKINDQYQTGIGP